MEKLVKNQKKVNPLTLKVYKFKKISNLVKILQDQG